MLVTNFFAFIGICVTIFGVIQGLDYLRNEQYKKEYEVTLYDYDIQNLIGNNHMSEKIKIYYQNNIVTNLYYKPYKIKNTGRKSINPSDYIENICIETGDNIVLGAQLSLYSNSYIQKNIIEKTSITENKICFPNILLNSDDYFQINIITKEFPKSNRIIGTISGIKKFNISNNTLQYKLNISKKIILWLFLIIIAFIVFLLVYIILYIIMQKVKGKKFIKKFNCNTQISKIFSIYYFKKIKYIRKNSTNIDRDIKKLNEEVKKYINDFNNKNDKF